MKVRKNSWHYRLFCFYKDPDGEGRKYNHGELRHRQQPKNLCRYFWFLVLGTLFIPFAAIGVALVFLAMLFVAGIAYLWDLRPVTVKKREKLERAPKEPNLVLEFVKAKKNRVCPIIEVVDDGS